MILGAVVDDVVGQIRDDKVTVGEEPRRFAPVGRLVGVHVGLSGGTKTT